MSLPSAMVRNTLSTVGIDAGQAYQRLSAAAIRRALREQGLTSLCESLRAVVPDVSDQYTAGFDPAAFARYWEIKMRGLHAFQTACTLDAIGQLDRPGLTIVDLGDSSGNHSAYLRALAPEGAIDRIVSVNLDEVAVRKINAKGGEAIHARVEDIDLDEIRPDLLISFETLEHLTDPIGFLHGIAKAEIVGHMLLSVPYRRTSRFGGALMRRGPDRLPPRLSPEETHIFELSPEDWRMLARFAGFRTVFSRVYLQYPKRSVFRLTAPLWRRLDFEGFLALFLERDTSLADRYTGW